MVYSSARHVLLARNLVSGLTLDVALEDSLVSYNPGSLISPVVGHACSGNKRISGQRMGEACIH